MAISDAFSTWSTTAASNSPAGSAAPEIDDELRNIKAQVKANATALSGDQTVAGVKTFSSIPVLPASDPTTINQATRKYYVDSVVTSAITQSKDYTKAVIPAGTQMLFLQSAAPTGWTQVTTVNDRVLRLVSGTGAGWGGSWTISGLTNAAVTPDESNTATHYHYMTHNGVAVGTSPTGYYVQFTTDNTNYYIAETYPTTWNWGSGGQHNHLISSDGNWRPSYINVICCSKDAYS